MGREDFLMISPSQYCLRAKNANEHSTFTLIFSDIFYLLFFLRNVISQPLILLNIWFSLYFVLPSSRLTSFVSAALRNYETLLFI